MKEILSVLLSSEVPFIRYAFITGIISSIPFGIIGSFVVVKRMSYIAGAVSHAVLGGIGIALFLNHGLGIKYITPMAGAFLIAIIMAAIISYSVISDRERLDTIIGVVWVIGMSIGLLFMSVTPGYIDPMSYLFGNILLLTSDDIKIIGFAAFSITSISVVFFNQISATIFDEDFARIRGLNVNFIQVLLIVLISITVLLLITIVGIVMVIAMLTIPPAIAGLFNKRLKGMIIISIALCAFFMTAGLVISYYLKLPTGSLTVVLAGIGYMISLAIRLMGNKRAVTHTG